MVTAYQKVLVLVTFGVFAEIGGQYLLENVFALDGVIVLQGILIISIICGIVATRIFNSTIGRSIVEVVFTVFVTFLTFIAVFAFA